MEHQKFVQKQKVRKLNVNKIVKVYLSFWTNHLCYTYPLEPWPAPTPTQINVLVRNLRTTAHNTKCELDRHSTTWLHHIKSFHDNHYKWYKLAKYISRIWTLYKKYRYWFPVPLNMDMNKEYTDSPSTGYSMSQKCLQIDIEYRLYCLPKYVT